MFNGFCSSGDLGSFGSFGLGSLIGVILNLIFLVGLIAALATLVVWAIRRVQVPGVTFASASGAPNAKVQNTTGGHTTAIEILQAQYVQGELTREQYELKKQDLV